MALPEPSSGSAALVTGASSGIGEHIARQLAERGHGVVLVARRKERLQTLAKELGDTHGVKAHPVAADLDSSAAREELFAAVQALGVQVDVLVNNAGFGGTGNIHRSDPDHLTAMVRLNCEALVHLQAHYSSQMAAREAGAIINVASTASYQPIPGTATYAATKAFVLSLSEAAHHELATKGVTLTAVCPGPVKTEFAESAGVGGAENRVPDFFWTEVEDVARDAVEGAERGSRVVVPGLLNRAGAMTAQHTPRWMILPVAKRAWRQAL